jgi:hypothetical protein
MIAVPLFILDLTWLRDLDGGFRHARHTLDAASITFGRGAVIMFLVWLADNGRMNITILLASYVLISIMDNLFNVVTAAMITVLIDAGDFNRANASRNAVYCVSMIVGSRTWAG